MNDWNVSQLVCLPLCFTLLFTYTCAIATVCQPTINFSDHFSSTDIFYSLAAPHGSSGRLGTWQIGLALCTLWQPLTWRKNEMPFRSKQSNIFHQMKDANSAIRECFQDANFHRISELRFRFSLCNHQRCTRLLVAIQAPTVQGRCTALLFDITFDLLVSIFKPSKLFLYR